MKAESRTKKSIRNSTVAMAFYVVNLALQFFSRKVFLDYLGTEILGLNTTATNLLQFLNLAELGINTAVGFSLYGPLQRHDTKAVNEIVALQGHLYKRVATVICVCAAILMAFFPKIFADMQLPMWYAYASFGVMLFSALLGYFVNYKQIVLSASQQDYKVIYSFKSSMIIKTIAQMVAISTFADGYVWWLALEVAFACIGSYALHRVTMSNFPGLNKVALGFRVLRQRYPIVTIKIKQLLFHKIGGLALTQSGPLIIYAFTSLSMVAVYGNYLMIIAGVEAMGRTLFNSVNAGIGNLVAEGNKEKIGNLFKELFSVRFLLTTSCCYCTYALATPFITLWIGSQYAMSNLTVALMVAMMYIQMFRLAAESFSYAYGLYGDIWAPIAEATLNIGFSILGGYYWSLNGVLAGAILSQIIIVVVWKPMYLFMREMKGFGRVYIMLYVKHAIVLAVTYFASQWIIKVIGLRITDVFSFVLSFMVHLCLFGGIMTALLLAIKSGLYTFLKRFNFAKKLI